MPLTMRLLAVAAAACVLAACPGDGDGNGARAVQIDTTNDEWEDGLSAEQVEAEAAAMSPEEAARAGLSVDTSIHLEELGARDTIPTAAAIDSLPFTAAEGPAMAPSDTL